MNETLKVIYNRRSIRSFKAEQIKEPEMHAVLEAGILAPSAKNTQKWHFTVVQNEDLLDRMSRSTAEIMKYSGNPQMAERASNPNYHSFYHAPAVIVISAEEAYPFAQNDCAAAAENIMLAAESLDIGSCWIASLNQLFKADKDGQYKKELGIPDGYIPVVSVALGYKASENPQMPPKNRDVVNYVK